MSLSSSFASERSHSTASSLSDFIADESRLLSDGAATTDADIKAESGDSSSLFLSDSNFTAAPASEGLLPRESIHRYIDQCVAPELIEHQRSTDGRLLTQLCEALVQLGGPEIWAARLPTDVLRGSIFEQPPTVPDNVESGATGYENDDNNKKERSVDYQSDDAALTWEEDLKLRNPGAGLPRDQVPWASLTRHLHQLTTRLNALLTRRGGCCSSYTLPPRLQARVTPVLYAWATCWRLAEADIRCWEAVVQAFRTASGTHQPPKTVASSTLVADSGSPAGAAVSPAFIEPNNATSFAAVRTRVKYTFTLPWKPLAALFLAVHEPANSLLASWAAVVQVVRRELAALCRRASIFFSADAVEGLWGLVCPQLQRSASGVQALSLFVHLVPYRHLCAQESAGKRNNENEEEKVEEEGTPSNVAAAPRLTPRAKEILRFLLVETASWTPSPPPTQQAGSAKGKGRQPHPLLMPWRTAVIVFVSSLMRAHPSAQEVDAYAEPLFTAWLNALALPVGSSEGMVGASAAAAVSRVVRGIGAPAAAAAAAAAVGRGGGGAVSALLGAAEAHSGRHSWSSTPFVRLLNAFPDNTESSLWRQLERWIHATSVLVRPGLPCTPGSAAARVCACYGGLAREALRRVPRARCDAEPSSTMRSGTSAESARAAAETSQAPPSPRYWSPATIDKFVQLFLPLAVSAFQTRAKTSVDFLVCLLAMSPTIVLPALLSCVDAGLHSPTEVAGQRRVAAVLLLHTVVTVFTDTERGASAALRSVRATVADYVQNSALLWIGLVSASTPQVANSVLTLLGVAVTYIASSMLMRSPYEAELLGTEFAARVIPLFTEHEEAGQPQQQQQQQQQRAVRQKHVEAFIAALPPSALAMVAKAVLKEAQNRDHGSRMCPLVRMVAVVAPAEAWRCAQQTWLPVLLDASAGDADAQWAGALLAASLLELGDRNLVRRDAGSVVQAVNVQLRFLTSRLRRGVAVSVTNALVAALLRPRCTPAPVLRSAQRQRWLGGGGGPHSGEGSPLSEPAQDSPSSCAEGAAVGPTGMATEAHVRVEWPSTEEDICIAVDFFNNAVRDIVRVVTAARKIRSCSPAVAAAAATASTAASLADRFVCDGSKPAAALKTAHGGGGAAAVASQRCVCESAAEVNSRNVVEGALEWLGRLLEMFEWLYAEAAPPATRPAGQEADSHELSARRGVCWADVNHRTAWWPGRHSAAHCRPAYSRAELFEIVHTHLCLPLLHHHVVAPLKKAGVELHAVLRSLLPLTEATQLAAEEKEEGGEDVSTGDAAGAESVVEWTAVCGVLRWLALSGIDCPQHFWLPKETSFRFWSRVVASNPSCRSRRAMPWDGWASRALQLHVDAAVAGYLPVSQETLSRTVTLLQCLSLSPHKAVRVSSVRLLMHDGLLLSLSADSLALFVRRQRALVNSLLAQWKTIANTMTSANYTDVGDEEAAAAAAAAAAVASRASSHTVQESVSGTLQLFATSLAQNTFACVPWSELQVLTALVTFPEELRSTSTAALLPWLQKYFMHLPPPYTATSRSPLYIEAVVQQAGVLVAAHPVRTILLLTLAKRLYWPSQERWLSMNALRVLARLAASPHVEVRSRATELLSAIAVHVAAPEAVVPVCLLRASDGDGEGGEVPPLRVPPTFLCTPCALAGLDEAAQQRHGELLRTVQASLARLAEVLPVLPQYLDENGSLFPLCVLSVPASVAAASGLPIVAQEDYASPDTCFVDSPHLLNALAAAPPPDAADFRAQWDELLVGAAAFSSSSSSPMPPSHSALEGEAASTNASSSSSWAVRVLSLPIERPLAGAAPEAAPSSLVTLLASVSCSSQASVQQVEMLLTWAEEKLQEWEKKTHAARCATASTDKALAADAEGVKDEGLSSSSDTRSAGGPRRVEEDEMYRLFLSVLTVAAAVVRTTTPPAPSAIDPNVRRRALQLLSAVLTCVSSHAAVPHLVMQSMMLLAITSVRRRLSVEETWTVLSSVLDELRGIAVDSPSAAEAENVMADGDGDVWSQRVLRLLTVALTVLYAVPRSITAALLPRLIALVGERARLFFMSPSDQVRRCSARLIAYLLTMRVMQSDTLVACKQCSTATRHLLSVLLGRVNTQIFHGRLPFTAATAEATETFRNGAAVPFDAEAAAAAAPAPSIFTAATTEDVALLTTTALVVQSTPVDLFVEFLDDLVLLHCYSLDLSFTKVQHLHDAAETALNKIATASLPKADAHRLLQHLCAVCVGAVPYGASRRAKVACTRALRFVAFRNLHRIGKYAMMLQVGDAALASLANRDASVRSEGSQLFAILTKVASESQTRVMVHTLSSECRMLSRRAAEASPPPPPHTQSAPMALSDISSAPPSPNSPSGAAAAALPVMVEAASNQSVGSDPANNRRMAVVQALGATVLADPGTPAPYVPKLMEALASCAREGNTECGRFAKRVFEQWWHAHREGWEQEYKKFFTAEQIDAMSDLLLAPRFYA